VNLPRPCIVHGCPNTVTGASRCPEHAVDRQMRKGSRQERIAREMKRAQPWCSYCGTPATPGNPLTIDHIVPLVRGGTNRRENKTVACLRCNLTKGDAARGADRSAPDAPQIVIG
jgi:5-methylcytosine-specific restriction endonuclease McrA